MFGRCWMFVLSGAAVSVPVGGARRVGTEPTWRWAGWCLLIHTEGWSCAHCTCSGLCMLLSWALLLGYPLSSSSSFLPLVSFKAVVKLFLPYHAYTVVQGHLSSSIVSSTDSDLLWHYAPWSFTLHGLCPSASDRRASVTLCIMLYSRWGPRTPQALIPKQEPKYLNFWQMQIPKISLSCVSLSVFSPLPYSMCIKRQTQHWL